MDFSTYQSRAATTDQTPQATPDALMIPLLGMAGEVGTLLSQFKKKLRDGTAHTTFPEQVQEDLGDLLWYVANVATKMEMDLNSIAERNLEKNSDRWPGERDCDRVLLDQNFPDHERFPEFFEIVFQEEQLEDRTVVRMTLDGEELGNPLTDNAMEEDTYRYHDAFHLACAAALSWSPVLRRLMKRKRKSNPAVDDAEDGARAAIIEELISQLVFVYAVEHDMLEGVRALDFHLLETIKSLVRDREVACKRLYEWESTILQAYEVWRKLAANKGGKVTLDLKNGRLEYVGEA